MATVSSKSKKDAFGQAVIDALKEMMGIGGKAVDAVSSVNQGVGDAMANAPFAFTDYAKGVGQGVGGNVVGLYGLARHPINSFVDISNNIGQMAAHPVDSVANILDRSYSDVATALSSPGAMGKYVGSMVQPGDLARAALAEPAIRELIAYHGSPHNFEPANNNPYGEFDINKVGTGEGKVQPDFLDEYGHGIYMTNDARNASQYMDANGLYSGKGYLYTADIPDKIAGRMLNWDDAIADQSKNVQKLAKEFGVKNSLPGSNLYFALSEKLGTDKAASEFLKSKGIPGHTFEAYYGLSGKDIQNYVIYDPSIAKIIKRE